MLQSDFFLIGCRDEFVENARIFMFETYCRIHKVIDIKYVVTDVCRADVLRAACCLDGETLWVLCADFLVLC